MPTNPLTIYMTVTESPDGVFVAVSPQQRKKFAVDDAVRSLDAALVTNYDEEKLRAAIERAEETPQRIGPPFEYFDPNLEKVVAVALSDMKATMRISPMWRAEGVRLTLSSLLFLLKKRKGVCYGLIPENIQRTLDENAYGEDILVAEGSPSIDGEDGQVTIEIDIQSDAKPQIKADGTVDFRDVKTFVQVAQGKVLATRIPPTPGTPGRSVLGREIAAIPGTPAPFPAGTNTVVSTDGKYLSAAKSGVIRRVGSLVAVCEVLEIERDVDFSVGNVKYAGDLTVRGDVKPGFTLEAEGNIDIHGVVDGANVTSRTGWIVVRGGILGKGQSVLFARQGIQSMFVQEASLETEGVIAVAQHCLHSNCICASFEATSRTASVIGGAIRAGKSVDARQLGNAQGIRTQIILADKKSTAAKEKIEELEALKTKIDQKSEAMHKQIQTKAAIYKKAGDAVTERQSGELKRWIDDYNGLDLKARYVQRKIDDLKAVMNKPVAHDGYVKVSGDVFPGVVLTLYELGLMIREIASGKCFRMGEGGIES